jgi:hypothetical protein
MRVVLRVWRERSEERARAATDNLVRRVISFKKSRLLKKIPKPQDQWVMLYKRYDRKSKTPDETADL